MGFQSFIIHHRQLMPVKLRQDMLKKFKVRQIPGEKTKMYNDTSSRRRGRSNLGHLQFHFGIISSIR
ncbi:MAG TPA: hypothetical protein PK269_05395, partial [Bacteroidales bacterium]|nr:hypothetical protein [Bacteroidales bacterium]